jgi:thymidylate synthase (FAD)
MRARSRRPQSNHGALLMEQEIILGKEIKCLNHGLVQLFDVMGDDLRAPRIARKSFRTVEQKTEEEDKRLARYLVRNRHTTPLEFNEVVFFMKVPIFVARQFIRHRTSSVEEVSLRYVEAVREFYIPELDRCQKQSESNKQGRSIELVDDPKAFCQHLENSCNRSFDDYERLLAMGGARELCRSVLPLGTYTEWYWKQDLHNMLHLLGLRLDDHAQYEIRVYAEAMLQLLYPIFPTIVDTWAETRGIDPNAELACE